MSNLREQTIGQKFMFPAGDFILIPSVRVCIHGHKVDAKFSTSWTRKQLDLNCFWTRKASIPEQGHRMKQSAKSLIEIAHYMVKITQSVRNENCYRRQVCSG